MKKSSGWKTRTGLGLNFDPTVFWIRLCNYITVNDIMLALGLII